MSAANVAIPTAVLYQDLEDLEERSVGSKCGDTHCCSLPRLRGEECLSGVSAGNVAILTTVF